jgi:transcription elongation GreA/GreB family factor
MIIVTEQSFKVREELYNRYEKRIQAAQLDKADAKSQGDLSENFGYVEAKKDVENYRRMQAELQFTNPAKQIVDPKEWASIDMEGVPRAMVGAKVSILRNGEKEDLLIGGAWDSDLENPKIVAYTSPLGKALIPKRPGMKVTIETSGEEIEIVDVTTATAQEIEALYSGIDKKSPKKKKEEVSMEI